ncbi:FecR domain-containing protein [Echinicola jeungdonensis]|uniref:FecR family protein n=1 Tax=Echinicola jeungdonensis TaxID=709343 RepID=A0ABV5J4Y2_9BACT|nr:FecR family protein [Echinicola jeungdonensis]MDN3668926.1 FecR domain-containing protein [Echinicola jeungdonensis]
MKYKDFHIEDFLKDEFFITWVKQPDEETDHFWKRWLENHPEKRQDVLAASEIIQSIHYKDEMDLTDQLYTEMYENIVSKDSAEKVKTRSINWGFWKNMAAALLLGACLYLAYIMKPAKKQKEPLAVEMITRENPAGQKSTITLSDGTKVHLNAKSSLTFPDRFSDSVRNVSLEGEAFFDVTENKNKPFVISTGDNLIKVLGTTFNVKKEEGLSVALVTGKVSVEDVRGNKIVLEPKEMVVKDKVGKITKTTFDPFEVIGWKDKYLVFKDDSFVEMKRKLEKWYGVDIQAKGFSQKDWSYSGVFYKETLENVLEGISITSNFAYKIEKKKVTIYNPK